MSYRYYRTPIPDDALEEQTGRARAELSRLTQLGGSGVVSQLGSQGGDLTLDLQYRGRYADRLQLELREAIESPGLPSLPLATTDATSTLDGYFTADTTAEVGPQSAQSTGLQRLRATLVREGTRQSHLQAIATRPQQVTHPFGNATTAPVGVPASAGRRQAVPTRTDPPTREPVAEAIVGTETAEHGAVDVVDVTQLPIEDPILTYQPAGYDPIGDVDAGVWDTWGAAEITDADGVVQWQRVFDPQHDFRGSAVLANGLRRLTLAPTLTPTEGQQTVTAEQYDAASDQWTALTLGDQSASGTDQDWILVAVDLIRVGPASVRAQLDFEDRGSSSATRGQRYAVNVALDRGRTDALVWLPDPNKPLPAGLETLFEPLASASVVDPLYGADTTQTLIATQELRQT